jgi:hypothetical protein
MRGRTKTGVREYADAVGGLKAHDLYRIIDWRPATGVRQSPIRHKPEAVTAVEAEHEGHYAMLA